MVVNIVAIDPAELLQLREFGLKADFSLPQRFLCLPRLVVLVSIEADRPGAWFLAPFGPYRACFRGPLSRDSERVKVSGNPMKSPFCFGVLKGVKFLRSLEATAV
jgi:hypothetical protein